MTREIGSVINVNGVVLKVERECDTCLCFNENGDECFFSKFDSCVAAFCLVGDCFADWRDDNTSVVFIEQQEGGENGRG